MRIVNFIGKIADTGAFERYFSYEESEELKGYVLTLQKFDNLIKEGIKNGIITVTENKIETDNTFDV